MGKIQRFTDLEVWRRSHTLFLQILKDIEHLPNTRAATVLCDQILRSIGSIGGNVSEGFNRSKKKYLSSLDIAVGEAAETENWLYKLRDTGVITADTACLRIRECIAIQKMLHGLIKSISNK